jgi:hypothetical protein
MRRDKKRAAARRNTLNAVILRMLAAQSDASLRAGKGIPHREAIALLRRKQHTRERLARP